HTRCLSDWSSDVCSSDLEVVFIAAVVTTVFFGGYQVPFLDADGFRIGGYMSQVGPDAYIPAGGWVLHLPHLAVVGLQFAAFGFRSEEHTSELQSLRHLVC